MTTEDLRGRDARLTFDVTADDTATAMLSGNVPVLATPRLLAWAEAASVAAIADWMPTGLTTVGTKANISHVAASPVGATVEVHAQVSEATAKQVTFTVSAKHWAGSSDHRLILTGQLVRAFVDIERFLAGVIPQA
ncbi:MAG: thioesterase [Actinobacteria bacterium]|nr:thioesterase [Actinomycetota bacterium]